MLVLGRRVVDVDGGVKEKRVGSVNSKPYLMLHLG
jgi:hypothetical protein